MIQISDIRQLYLSNYSAVFDLPPKSDVVRFECFDYAARISEDAIGNIIWRLHTLAPIETLSVVVNPSIKNTTGVKAIDLLQCEDRTLLTLNITRLADIRRLFGENKLYGIWTFLGAVHANNTIDSIKVIRSLGDFSFGLEVDIDSGIVGFGNPAIADKPIDYPKGIPSKAPIAEKQQAAPE